MIYRVKEAAQLAGVSPAKLSNISSIMLTLKGSRRASACLKPLFLGIMDMMTSKRKGESLCLRLSRRSNAT